MGESETNELCPLYVDLDGTLVKTDVAQELSVRLLSRPALWLSALGKLLSGRAGFKRLLSEQFDFDPARLPYVPEVLEFLRKERAKGREIILATGCDRFAAEKISAHLALFDRVLASDSEINLTGAAKLDAIKADANGPFDYLGNSRADEPVWAEARKTGIVHAPDHLTERMAAKSDVALMVPREGAGASALLKALRPHQWAKNILVLLPLFFSHNYLDPQMLWHALQAMVVFSMCASAIYILNDLLDIEADRLHPTKCRRPFAAGRLLPSTGLLSAFGLIYIGFAISFLCFNWAVSALFALYILTTTLYSTWFKHKASIDIVVLTCLYALRIFVGGVVIGVIVSPWLLNFSLFFFASLALMKRFIEVKELEHSERDKIRGYYFEDVRAILPMGVTAGGLAVLTLTLYLNNPTVAETYAAPALLWLIAPLTLYWIFRAWLMAMRGHVDEDPVVFALRDSISRYTILITAGIIILSKYVPFEGVLL